MSSQTIPHANDAGVLSSPWDDALFDVPARAGLERMLPAFIAARRWYRTKTKHVHDARIVAAFPLKYGPLEATTMSCLLSRELPSIVVRMRIGR